MFKSIYCILCKPAKISPTGPAASCEKCYEPGGAKRKCCNACLCDHCYTKDKKCPNCGTSTRKEEMTGATYTLPLYSEHEECRRCLEPGLRRSCCGNYYCDECYYSFPKCRSCEAPVGKKGIGSQIDRAAMVSIVIGWGLSLFLLVAITAFFLTLVTSEVSTPISISGYKCYGFFRQCEIDVCVEMQPSVATGDSALPPLDSWRSCSLTSQVKLQSKACVYDPQLYTETSRVMGYDVCIDNFAEGVFIFEDTFENWGNSSFKSNRMDSALWNDVMNGAATSYCGVANTFGGEKALTFSGQLARFAETKDLDISNGGWLEAELFIAPLFFDVRNPNCKTNYFGSVDVEYSTDGGANWVNMKTYDAQLHRSESFFPIVLVLPRGAQTNHTRFRFNQPQFEAARDGWALDNVKVFRYLPTDWHVASAFRQNVHWAYKQIQRAQCCFDTDWCETRMTEAEMKQCRYLPWYVGRKYELRSAELFICLAVLVNLLKFFYISGQDWLMRGRFPFNDEFDEITRVDWIMKYVPARYRPKKNLDTVVANVHLLARLGNDIKEMLDDEEGDGDRIKQEEEIKQEKEKARLKRLKKLKKKLEKKKRLMNMKNNRFAQDQAKAIEETEKEDRSSEEEEEKEEPKDPTKFGTEILATNLDRIKRQSLAMLRVPFDIQVSVQWTTGFAVVVLGLFLILVLYKISTTTYYIVFQRVRPYGAYDGEISVTSLGINFFAVVCDFKEIFYTIKFVIPARPEWYPLVTIDRTEEVNSLFVGPFTIPISNIKAVTIFSRWFAIGCAAGYFLGCFPWCIISIILRDQYLNFPSMRIVSPILCGIMLSRALLGAGFVVKICFTIYYLVSWNMHTREKVGLACQAEKTYLAAINASVIFSLLGVFICSAVALEWAGMVFGAMILIGLIFGAATGFIHELPVRPWMCLTMLDGGMYLTVKKKQKCPCLYWGKYCTEMHDSVEALVLFTKDDVRFISIIKGGTGSS